jgi:hypothetical protein
MNLSYQIVASGMPSAIITAANEKIANQKNFLKIKTVF